MKRITFKQFMLTYNFRYIAETSLGLIDEKYNNDTEIIRIYLPNDEEYDDTDWFEFGVYNFDSESRFLKRLERIFTKDILESYVCRIQYNTDYQRVVTIYLTHLEENDNDGY